MGSSSIANLSVGHHRTSHHLFEGHELQVPCTWEVLQNDGRPRDGIASLADCREHFHGELRTQRNLDHEGSSALVAPLRGWRLGHRQTHFPPVIVLGPIWKKASGSWLLFQIERAKVWSPRWVENDKRKGFGGVVENCGVQTLSKNRFFLSVRQGRRRGMRLTPSVSISLWFTAELLCDLPPMSGHGLDGRACKWNIEVFTLLQGNILDVPEWLKDFGELKFAYGSHDEFLVLLFFRVFDYSLKWELLSLCDWLYFSSICLRNSSSWLRSQIPFFFLN